MTYDAEAMERVLKLRAIMNDWLRHRSAQQRDRDMQVHLAEARGPMQNARFIRCAYNFAIRLRSSRTAPEAHHADRG